MRLNLWVWLILPIVLLSACARTSPFVDETGIPIIDPQVVPEPTQAILCIYRPSGSDLALPPPM